MTHLRVENLYCKHLKTAAVCLVAAGLLVCSSRGIDVKNLTLARFKARSPRNDASEGWEIEGRQAVMNGPVVHLDQARLKLFLKDGKEAVATTSDCEFDDRDKTLRSADRLFLEHPSFRLTGKGFTLYSSDQRVVVHSQVKVVIKSAATRGRSFFDRLKATGPTPKNMDIVPREEGEDF